MSPSIIQLIDGTPLLQKHELISQERFSVKPNESELNKASTAKAFLTHFRSMFGVGIIAMPNLLTDVGIPLGVAAYTILAITCAYTPRLLLRARSVTVSYIEQEKENSSHDSHDSRDIMHVSNVFYGNSSHHKMKTYGEIAHTIAGKRVGTSIRYTVITVYIMLACSLVICINDTLRDLIRLDDIPYGIYIVAALQIGIFSALVQITALQDLFLINAVSLLMYIVGVICCSVYTAAFVDDLRLPDDSFETRWGGLISFIGSATFTLENVGMTIPTFESMAEPKNANFVVSSSMLSYAFVSLTYSSVAYIGGVGGLTINDECKLATNCIEPEGLKWSVEICLMITLMFSYPLFLFPAIDMLEVSTAYKRLKKRMSGRENGMVLDNDDSAVSMPRAKNMKIRFSLVVLSVIIGTIVDDFAYFAAFVGSILMAYAGFVLPSVLYLVAHRKANESLTWGERSAVIYILVFGSTLTVVGGYMSFVDMVKYGFRV